MQLFVISSAYFFKKIFVMLGLVQVFYHLNYIFSP